MKLQKYKREYCCDECGLIWFDETTTSNTTICPECKNSFIANSVEVLKSKAQPYIENEKVNQIVVSKVEDIGFFKVPIEEEKYITKDILL